MIQQAHFGIQPKGNEIWISRDTYTPMFIAVLFIIAR